jgi:hypothetical protein
MVLVDKKILSGGLVMMIVGIVLSLYLSSVISVGTSGMTEEETLDLLIRQQENQDMNNLSGILMGIGFLLVLISFGARRKRKGGVKKSGEKARRII